MLSAVVLSLILLLESGKSTDQILAQLIRAGGKTLHSDVDKITDCIWKRKNCQSSVMCYCPHL
jgi:hypothetical protein